MSAIGWDNDCKQFKLSHKPSVAGLNCRGWQYDKRNLTLLYFTVCIHFFLSMISLVPSPQLSRKNAISLHTSIRLGLSHTDTIYAGKTLQQRMSLPNTSANEGNWDLSHRPIDWVLYPILIPYSTTTHTETVELLKYINSEYQYLLNKSRSSN